MVFCSQSDYRGLEPEDTLEVTLDKEMLSDGERLDSELEVLDSTLRNVRLSQDLGQVIGSLYDAGPVVQNGGLLIWGMLSLSIGMSFADT